MHVPTCANACNQLCFGIAQAYAFYCGKNLENAHSAEADTTATYEVLKAQIEKYDMLDNDIAKLSAFSTRRKSLDFAGFILVDDDGDPSFGFGKHKGKKVVDVLQRETGYFSWLLDADFPLYTKKVLTNIRLETLNTNS